MESPILANWTPNREGDYSRGFWRIVRQLSGAYALYRARPDQSGRIAEGFGNLDTEATFIGALQDCVRFANLCIYIGGC